MNRLLYNGKLLTWKKWDRGGWHVIAAPGFSNSYLASVRLDDNVWFAYRVDSTGSTYQIDNGSAEDLEAAKAAAENCLLDNGVVTLVSRELPTTGAYTFHFRADKGGATVVATVVRGPDTTVLYGVSYCSPRDSFDKNLGRRLAAFRLIDKPSVLVLPGLVGPREIKAAIFGALVIPPGNHLLRSI